MKSTTLVGVLITLAPRIQANESHQHTSPCSGQELCDIKCLSGDDIAELMHGGGWGLTNAAELNILTVEQVEEYNRLRDCIAGNARAQVPQGHDLAMWRKHNGCV